jgi:predicted RNA-binding Zn ribbon-like protein
VSKSLDFGKKTALDLLVQLKTGWKAQVIKDLLGDLELAAEYYVTKKGGVDIGAYVFGTVAQLVALALGEAYSVSPELLRTRIAQCDNPACQKWFMAIGPKPVSADRTPGRRRHCCADCANRHKSLRASEHYEERRRKKLYPVFICTHC